MRKNRLVFLLVLGMFLLQALLAPVLLAAPPEEPGGLTPALIGCCLGSRVGYMYNEGVDVRMKEWLTLIPYVGIVFHIINVVEVYQGRTWTEVEKAENLRAEFKEWHKWMAKSE